MDIAEKLGKRIKKIRKSRKITQQKLAEKVGLSDKYIGAIERGERSPSVKTLDKIANALGIGLSELFYFEEDYATSKETILQSLMDRLKKRDRDEIMVVSDVIKTILEKMK